MKKVSFLGLGVMGYPMAGWLQKKGYEVAVYNRTPEKAAKWVEEYQGAAFDTPAEAVRGAEIVFLCLGDDPDVSEMIERAAGGLGKRRHRC